MKRILSFSISFLSLICVQKSAAEIQVIQVRRNIPLSDEEPVFKDYYLSGGTKDGLRMNLVVPVNRWINLRDNNQAQDQSMKILEPVGWIKIIFIQDHLAVGRLYEAVDYSKTPILDQPGILIGDTVSLEHSYTPKNLVKPPKDSSQVQEKQTQNSILPSPTGSLALPMMPQPSTGELVSSQPKTSSVPPAPVNGPISTNTLSSTIPEVKEGFVRTPANSLPDATTLPTMTSPASLSSAPESPASSSVKSGYPELSTSSVK